MGYRPLELTMYTCPLCFLTFKIVFLHALPSSVFFITQSLVDSPPPHFLFPLFPPLLVLTTEPSAFHMPATPALCYSCQFIPTKPHLLLRVSLTFLGQVLVLNPPLCCPFNPWDTNPHHAFNLEITESTIGCPGGYKFLLEVRSTWVWYLGDFGGDWVNRG